LLPKAQDAEIPGMGQIESYILLIQYFRDKWLSKLVILNLDFSLRNPQILGKQEPKNRSINDIIFLISYPDESCRARLLVCTQDMLEFTDAGPKISESGSPKLDLAGA
jgi:hypothetical protein